MRAFNLSDKGVYSQTKNWKSAEWIHVENPDSDDVADLMSTFGIPMDYILDSLDEYEIPRQERVNNGSGDSINLLIVLFPKMRSVQEKFTEYHTYPLSIITVNDTLITICKETPSFLAKKSTILKPILWRVLTYSAPILPRPTIKYLLLTLFMLFFLCS